MKFLKVALLVLVATFFLSTTARVMAAEKGIATVDLAMIFDQYYKTKNYDGALEQKTKSFEADRKVKTDKVQENEGKLALMKENEKAKLQEEIDKQKAELMEFDRQRTTDLRKERDEKLKEILMDIEKVVKDYAVKEGYTAVLNNRVLIYGSEQLDITKPILEILNKDVGKAGK